jgi:hypothetical protein
MIPISKFTSVKKNHDAAPVTDSSDLYAMQKNPCYTVADERMHTTTTLSRQPIS